MKLSDRFPEPKVSFTAFAPSTLCAHCNATSNPTDHLLRVTALLNEAFDSFRAIHIMVYTDDIELDELKPVVDLSEQLSACLASMEAFSRAMTAKDNAK